MTPSRPGKPPNPQGSPKPPSHSIPPHTSSTMPRRRRLVATGREKAGPPGSRTRVASTCHRGVSGFRVSGPLRRGQGGVSHIFTSSHPYLHIFTSVQKPCSPTTAQALGSVPCPRPLCMGEVADGSSIPRVPREDPSLRRPPDQCPLHSAHLPQPREHGAAGRGKTLGLGFRVSLACMPEHPPACIPKP